MTTIVIMINNHPNSHCLTMTLLDCEWRQLDEAAGCTLLHRANEAKRNRVVMHGMVA